MDKSLTVAQQTAYHAGWEYHGSALLTAWEREILGPARVNPEHPIAAACFEAGVLGQDAPRWVTGWRYGAVPAEGYSRNHRDGFCEAGVSIMQIDGEPSETDGTFALFHADRPRVRVAGWLLGRRGSDGERLIIGAAAL